MIDAPLTVNPVPAAEVRHSRLGIASFTVSVAVGLAFLVLFVVVWILFLREPASPYLNSTSFGLIVYGLWAADVLAVGLGVAGVFQSGVKKAFAILGTVFSALTIVGTICICSIGHESNSQNCTCQDCLCPETTACDCSR